MLLTQQHSTILKAVEQFQQIEKYQGVMPRKHACLFRDADVSALVDQGLLDWAKFTFDCGKELKGLRLTVKGQRLLDQQVRHSEMPAQITGTELAYEHLLILEDLHHFCRMPRYRRMMPEKKARHYNPTDFEDLLHRGYILKVRLKADGEQSFKGYVISSKGEHALAEARQAIQ